MLKNKKYYVDDKKVKMMIADNKYTVDDIITLCVFDIINVNTRNNKDLFGIIDYFDSINRKYKSLIVHTLRDKLFDSMEDVNIYLKNIM